MFQTTNQLFIMMIPYFSHDFASVFNLHAMAAMRISLPVALGSWQIERLLCLRQRPKAKLIGCWIWENPSRKPWAFHGWKTASRCGWSKLCIWWVEPPIKHMVSQYTWFSNGFPMVFIVVPLLHYGFPMVSSWSVGEIISLLKSAIRWRLVHPTWETLPISNSQLRGWLKFNQNVAIN